MWSTLPDADRFRLVLENAFDLLVETDLEGTYSYVSPNVETLLGRSASEMVGRSSHEFVHPQDIERLRVEWHEHMAGRLDRVDYRLKHANGTWRWFEAVGRRAESADGTQRLLVIARDIMERKRHEAELAALVALGEAVNSHVGAREQIQEISRHLKPFLPFDDLFVSVREGEDLVLFAGVFDAGDFAPFRRANAPESPHWEALEKGEILVNNHASVDLNGERPVRSYVNVPLRIEGKSIGFLHLDSRHENQWTQDHVRLAGLVGEQVATTVWQAKLLERSREQEAKLAESNALLRATQEAAADGICLVDDGGRVVAFNGRFAQLWNIDAETGVELAKEGQVMSHVLEQLADPDEFIEKIAELFDQPEASARDEILLKDGRYFERYSAPAVSSDENGNRHSFGRIWSFIDISDRKRYEERLTHQAFHDPVTGLPNRVLFIDRLSRALAVAERMNRLVAVLFLDLDRFKVVNDSLGHDKGDQLLIQVAHRLSQSLRAGDTAARFGGDEFVVLLEEVTTSQDATRIAERIAQNLREPFHLEGHEVQVTTSIGIVLSEPTGNQPDDLLRKADVAMYRAKNRGRAQYEIFTEALSEQALERLKLELELNGVTKRDELLLHYQPLVDLTTGYVSGFEALVRWQHPQRGMVSPAAFIPVAEETGQIVGIGAWVLQEACRQAQEWTIKHQIPVLMNVNLSVRQFEQANLVEEVARVLRETQLRPEQLVIEITESAVMTDAKGALEQLGHLKELGVRVSMDDFGTGYSSLSYLEFFPIDSLKIDRSFVKRLDEGTAVVRAVAMLGQAMNVVVAAEGIETREQLDQLRALKCGWGQGYLFSRPVPAAEAEKLIGQNVIN